MSTSSPEPPPVSARTRRAWAALAVAGVVGFFAYLVVSAREAAVPVGASGPMPGMAMGEAPVQFTVRDIGGRPLALPGGRPGVMVFVQAGRCEECVAATRAASRVVEGSPGRPALVVLVMDSFTAREEVEAFARSARAPGARYAIDDRGGSVQTMVGAPPSATALVYDARGRILASPGPDPRKWERALRRAARGRPAA